MALNAPKTILLAGNEASAYLQATLMRVWAKKGHTPVVPVSASRDNTHFYGALNMATGKETLLRSALMNSEVSALFLQKLLDAYPNLPLLLLWDRAPWHKGEAVARFWKRTRAWKSCGFHPVARS